MAVGIRDREAADQWIVITDKGTRQYLTRLSRIAAICPADTVWPQSTHGMGVSAGVYLVGGTFIDTTVVEAERVMAIWTLIAFRLEDLQ